MAKMFVWDLRVIDAAASSGRIAEENAKTGRIAASDLKIAIEAVERTILGMNRGNIDPSTVSAQLFYIAHGYTELAKAIRTRFPDSADSAGRLQARAALVEAIRTNRKRVASSPSPNQGRQVVTVE